MAHKTTGNTGTKPADTNLCIFHPGFFRSFTHGLFMKIFLSSGLVLASLLVSGAAMAQTAAPTTTTAAAAEPEFTLGYNLGLTSDYRVRGMSQTAFKPAVMGGVDYANKNGIYLGLAAANVSWVKEFNGATKGSYEVDLYGGYKGAINKDFSYDIGLITYRYPGNDSGVANPARNVAAGAYSKADTTEIYGALTYTMFTFKYSRSTGDFLGNLKSSGSQYFDLSAAFDLGEGMTITPHIGRQSVPNQNSLGNYSDASLSFSKDFGSGLVASIAGVTTNANRTFYSDTNGRFLGKSGLLVGVKYSF
jgi:uncharacterized protein (TIGR02001 family)